MILKWSLVLSLLIVSRGKKVSNSTCWAKFVAIMSSVAEPLVGPVSSILISGKSSIAGPISLLLTSPPITMYGSV